MFALSDQMQRNSQHQPQSGGKARLPHVALATQRGRLGRILGVPPRGNWGWGAPLTACGKPVGSLWLACCRRVVTKGLRRGYDGVTMGLRRESRFFQPRTLFCIVLSACLLDATAVAQVTRRMTSGVALARSQSPPWWYELDAPGRVSAEVWCLPGGLVGPLMAAIT